MIETRKMAWRGFGVLGIAVVLSACAAAPELEGPMKSSAALGAALSWAQQGSQLVADDGVANVYFGTAAALSGDTALLGTLAQTVGSNDSQGTAYAFVRVGTNWMQQGPQITASDGAATDDFGTALSVSGDTALIGAHGRNGGQGAAYVLVRSGAAWSEQGSPLTASDGAANDGFGSAVAISGDTALIGAPRHDGGHGAAYVFVRSGMTWSEQGSPLTASDGTANDAFGQAVALSGDTALIGAPYKAAGAAYAFLRAGTTWTQQGSALVPSASSSNGFGLSVSVSGDTALIGEPFGGAGLAHVFVRSGTTWSEQGPALTASDLRPNATFGKSVDVSGDLALIGAYNQDVGANTQQGAAYVFARAGSSWTQQGAALEPSDGATSAEFGSAVALSGTTALIGSPGKAVGTTVFQGAAYVFTGQCAADAGCCATDAGCAATTTCSAANCAAPSSCDATGKCVAPEAAGAPGADASSPTTTTSGNSSGCGCRVNREGSGTRSAGAVGLLLLAGIGLRKRLSRKRERRRRLRALPGPASADPLLVAQR